MTRAAVVTVGVLAASSSTLLPYSPITATLRTR